MPENRPPTDPEQIALDAIWELWGDGRPPKYIKEKGLPILQSLGIKGPVHEGEAYDLNKVGTWYLGQVYEAINSQRLDDLGNLMVYTERYTTPEFFGKNLHNIFERVRSSKAHTLRVFISDHKEEDDWLDPAAVSQRDSLFKNPTMDRGVFAGRKVAFVIQQYPDKEPKIVDGELLSNDTGPNSSIYFVDTGRRIAEVDNNNVIATRVEDVSEPKYRQIMVDIKRNYKEITDEEGMKRGQEFFWLMPDQATGTWRFVPARVISPATLRSSVMTISVGGTQEEINFNFFRRDGNRIYSKKIK